VRVVESASREEDKKQSTAQQIKEKQGQIFRYEIFFLKGRKTTNATKTEST